MRGSDQKFGCSYTGTDEGVHILCTIFKNDRKRIAVITLILTTKLEIADGAF
jgi:hypothetical protein